MTNNTTAYTLARGTPAQVTSNVVGALSPIDTNIVMSQGTFVANGVSAVTVTDPAIAITSIIDFSLNTVGGTVGAQPTIATITAGSMTVKATASDTSTYNYLITNISQATFDPVGP